MSALWLEDGSDCGHCVIIYAYLHLRINNFQAGVIYREYSGKHEHSTKMKLMLSG